MSRLNLLIDLVDIIFKSFFVGVLLNFLIYLKNFYGSIGFN